MTHIPFPKPVDQAEAIGSAIMVILSAKIPALMGGELAMDILQRYRTHANDIFGTRGFSKNNIGLAHLRAHHLAQFDLSSHALETFQEKLIMQLRTELKEARLDNSHFTLTVTDETISPVWLNEIVNEMRWEGINFPDLKMLVDFREGVSIVVHPNGRIYWGERGYGGIGSYTPVGSYWGQPEDLPPAFSNVGEKPPYQLLSAKGSHVLNFGTFREILVAPEDVPVDKRLALGIRADLVKTRTLRLKAWEFMATEMEKRLQQAEKMGKSDIQDIHLQSVANPEIILDDVSYGQYVYAQSRPDYLKIETQKLPGHLPKAFSSGLGAPLHVQPEGEGTCRLQTEEIAVFQAIKPFEFGAGDDNIKVNTGDYLLIFPRQNTNDLKIAVALPPTHPWIKYLERRGPHSAFGNDVSDGSSMNAAPQFYLT